MIGSQPGGEATSTDIFGDHRGGPTVLRIVLGSQLRRLRERRQITCEEAGEAIRASHSKISRMELGRVRCRRRDVADLLTLYGVTDEDEQKGMLALADRANEPGWWHSYSDILPNWFEIYIGLEEAASRIRTYEVQFVPGSGCACDGRRCWRPTTRHTCGRWWTRRCCGAPWAASGSCAGSWSTCSR
jgi:transcriptional regulator with XRE-family HTH domain